MKKIIIQKGDFFDKYALVEDGKILKIKLLDKSQDYFQNDIFIASKKKENISMRSYTFSLTKDLNGFMHYEKQESFEKKLVQIKKMHHGSKNPVLTDKITLVGLYVIIVFGDTGINLAKNQSDESLKEQVSQLIDKKILDSAKIIIRSYTKNEDIEKLIQEVNYLYSEYNELQRKASITSEDKLIYRQYEPSQSFLIDNPEAIELITNDKELYHKYKNQKKHIENAVLLEGDLFLKQNLQSEVNSLLNAHVKVNSQINLIIQKTDAMYVIDVNSGGFFKHKDKDKNALEINELASKEIARQIALRGISGLVAIDFIDMYKPSYIQALKTILCYELNSVDINPTIESSNSIFILTIRKKDLSLQEYIYDKNISLYSENYIFDEIDHKLASNEKKEVEINIPLFESKNALKNIEGLEKKYDIKIRASFLKKENLKVKIINTNTI